MKKILIILSFIAIVLGQTYIVNGHLLVKGDILMEGNANDAFEGKFDLPSVTADRTWTLPDADLNFGSIWADPMTTRGDIIYRNSSNTTARLGLGTNKYVLQSDGTDLAWSEFLASEMAIVDAGIIITATDVEGALQENRIAIDLNTTHRGLTNNPHSVTKAQVGLTNVEDTALSTWAGTTNITTLGTIVTGVWNGTAILDAYISSSATWNAKIANLVEDTTPQLGGSLDGQGYDLNNLGVIFMTEQALAEADIAGKLQLWAKTATPNQFWWTDDVGNDREGVYSGGAFHDGFSDFVANEHIDHSGVTLTAGDGLGGGGDLTTNRTFAVLLDVDGGLETVDDSINVKLDGATLTKGTSGLKVTDSTFQPLDGTLTAFAGLTIGANELIYGTGADAFSMLSVNATATNKFLRQVSSGAPSWEILAAGDIPDVSGTYQPLDGALTNISGLTYVSPSFIKLTANDTYAVRTLAEVKTDLSLNNVDNVADASQVVVGALDGGSITSNFGTINTGASNITTTGTVSATTLTGTLSTAAQTNITSLGTQSSFLATVGGFGIARTEGTLHVHTATAGAVTPQTYADDLIVENNAHAGITILAPDNQQSTLNFGSPTDNEGATVNWVQSTGTFSMGSAQAGADAIFKSGNAGIALTLDGSQNATFAGTTIDMIVSGTTLTVGVGADNGTVSAGVFTDRTPFYDGDALTVIKNIKGKGGRIDHKSLPDFVRVEKIKTTKDSLGVIISTETHDERNIGNMISINVRALQQLVDINENQELVIQDLIKRIEKLE